MSIAQANKIKILEERLETLEALLKSNGLQSEIDALKSRLDALENKPRPGRPPKATNE